MKLKFIRRLGHGGFGNVDLVADDAGNHYARKTFSVNQPLAPNLEGNVKRRFIREATIQKGFSHKNIVPVLAEDLAADPPWYLMPVAISSLDKDVEADRSLGGKFLSAISDIVAGLEELHNVEYYHRDLKPQNVLRFRDGEDEYYAIGDFGFISQRDSTLSKLTTTGMAKGSDYYTAPEIAADLKKASVQSDIFSLGCILHDMVGVDDRVPCQEIDEAGEFGGLLRSCTRSSPKRRFKSARAVLDALLSLDFAGMPLETEQAESYLKLLEGDAALDREQWQQIIDYVGDHENSRDSHALLMKLTLERIEQLFICLPDEAERLASALAAWIQSSSFDFSACDGLANRLELFIQYCSLGAKAECLLAMLEMGTSHNRWYVERMFVRLCGPDMEELLAKRLAMEFRVGEREICASINHLEASIGFDRAKLHRLLVKTLAEICA
jgi:eukaryotic-like serine/threonine-protein kinase